MPEFLKRPVRVQAEQWFPGRKIPGVSPTPGGNRVVTGEDEVSYVFPGYWLVVDPEHEYPRVYTDAEFALKYEPIGGGDHA